MLTVISKNFKLDAVAGITPDLQLMRLNCYYQLS